VNTTHLSPIANHLWQSTVFAVIVGLLTLVLRNNRARVRHWVWIAASWKFLIPFSVLVSLGGHVHWRTAPHMTLSNLSVVVDEVGQPFTAPAPSQEPLPALPGAGAVLTLLLTVSACGFVGITYSWWIRWMRIRAAVRAGSPVDLEIPIRAVSSTLLLEPGVFGVFRPVVLLPEGILDRLTAVQLKGVIAHELCHAYHRDNLMAAIHMFVETLFWFHPLVWWIGKRMVEERERACDEAVLQFSSEPRVYAEGILNICKLYLESPLRCVSGVAGPDLKRRIEVIMANRVGQRLNRAKKLLLASAGIAALAGPVAIGVSHVPAIRAESQAMSAPQSRPAFDVASIKLNTHCDAAAPSGGSSSPSRIAIECADLRDLILTAYGIYGNGANPAPGSFRMQVVGGPSWMDSTHYDIVSKPAGNPPRSEMYGPMLQSLLEERFQLKVHRETTTVPSSS
jgi:beta-lactamase regulating signal transducer with metallopeptidase domain